MRETASLYAFNRGVVSPLGLARVDQKRVALSAEDMTNMIARVLGSMSLRPGWGYTGATDSNNKPRYIPFVFATDDTALVEFTDATMRVWIGDTILTRSSVSTTVTNGTFAGNITGWTDGSDSGGAIAWDTGNYLKLTGNGTARAIGYQAVTVLSPDQATEHGLHITIDRGPITFKVGTALADDSLVSETTLDAGVHSIAFTPNAATFYIQFSSTYAYKVRVTSCVVEAAGVVTITSPYAEADLGKIRFDQSADVIFLSGASTYQQRKVERRGTRPGGRSWSLAVYQTTDGPFRADNFSATTLTASALVGDITLTASRPLFKSTHVGGLFSLTNQVVGVSASVTGADQWTTGIKVTGAGNTRSITITLTGTFVATASLQSSPDNSTWADVPGEIWNGSVSGPYLDGLDNQTTYYRVGVKVGNYTSGTVQAALTYTSGGLLGVARVTAFTSSTVVSAQVLFDIGSTSATASWAEGSWSSYRGWPTAVSIHESRLWWAGQNGVFGSESDDFYGFDQSVVSASGPINRTIGSGPVDTINWLRSLQRLVIGTQGSEISARSSALDVPLSPTDFSLKICSTQGSGAVDTVRIDQHSVYVDRTGVKVYQLDFDLKNYLYPDYSSTDLTALVPEFGLPGIVRMAVQRKPDTRIHCVRSDGTVMMAILDKVEDVLCWLDIETDGEVEDVVVLPGALGSTEDQVYYAVKRTINGSTVRYLEKWAKETECRGSTLNKQADAFITFTNSPASSTVSGLAHLVGEDVIAWYDGICPADSDGDIETFTVSASGTITLGEAASTGIVGLPYTAQWQSAKLGLQPSAATSTLNQQKKIDKLGIVAAWIPPKGIKFGPDFDSLDDMPSVERGAPIDQDTIRTEYEEQPIPFPSKWLTDARLCIEMQAPRPATLLAVTPDLEMFN